MIFGARATILLMIVMGIGKGGAVKIGTREGRLR
jgi:hypothetical protein